MNADFDRPVEIGGYRLSGEFIAWWHDALARARTGDLRHAIATLEGIVQRQPEFLPARVQIAYLMLAADRYRDARQLALSAAATDGVPEFALDLIRLLRRFEEHAAISELVARTDWTGRSPGLLLAVASELGPIGLYAQAGELLDRAERSAPAHPGLALLRGTLLMMSGETVHARNAFEEALRRSPAPMPHVLWMMTLQPDEADLHRQIAEARSALRHVAPGSEDEAYLWHALHNLHHAAGEYEEAWRALEQGARVKRRLEPYDRAAQHALFRLLKEADYEGTTSLAAADDVPRLIFIVGMHRSGTSIVERVLAGHRDVADSGESYAFTAALRDAADHYCSGVTDALIVKRASEMDPGRIACSFRTYARWRANGKRWFTEKLPSNFLNLGFILQALPEARVLHMRRDAVDTCFSNLRTFFSNAAAYSYDQADLADYYLQYDALMRHWHARFPGRILDVDYEEFVASPEEGARRLMSFCGLDFDPDALDVRRTSGFTATASIGSVRQGILRNRGGVWVRYEKYLGDLLSGLGRS